MKTKEFIEIISQNPDLSLSFEYAQGKFVRSDFHITEIKNVTFDTVDCGGKRNQWEETHVQLWENQFVEPDHKVNAEKALKIFQVVENVRPTFQNTDIKFEYGNENFPTTILSVGEISQSDSSLVVKLYETGTTCKAKDRATTEEEKAAACCPSPQKKIKVSLKSLKPTKSNNCTPESNCC
ncbi:DUF6428 family protein [Echinicola salinicaeni]|uniref:DUF6428 family protein n=1 Tax=Echinicola salinicaeni TaxID=2762757 RepID=UPI001645F785|nr:DUF6428 family protein [Echinicola salinicaeni]